MWARLRARAMVWVTQPSPHLFQHICTWFSTHVPNFRQSLLTYHDTPPLEPWLRAPCAAFWILMPKWRCSTLFSSQNDPLTCSQISLSSAKLKVKVGQAGRVCFRLKSHTCTHVEFVIFAHPSFENARLCTWNQDHRSQQWRSYESPLWKPKRRREVREAVRS